MNRFLPLFACALGGLVSATTAAHADPTPAPNAQWSYNFTPQMTNNQALASDGLSGVNFTNEPTKTAQGSSDVVVSNLKAFSNSTSQVGFGSGGNYTIGLVLTDAASGATANFSFHGKLGGNLSGTNANVTNPIAGITGSVTINGSTVNFTGPMAPTIALGNFNYAVALTGYTPPGPPNASNAGSISAHVNVTNGSVTTATVSPEPSTLVLAGLGLSVAGLVACRQRRRNLAAALA
jgi:hypothetical protein